jgi:hypothetical protein
LIYICSRPLIFFLASIAQNKAAKTGQSEAKAINSMAFLVTMKRVGKPKEVAHAIAF